MTFKRARTDNQKNTRIDEIINATLNLYNTIGYEKVTLSNIAKNISFSRINLYKYFNTKEEIFLKILSDDATVFADDLICKVNTLSTSSINNSLEIKNLANLLATTLYEHKRFLHLLTLELSVIHGNVDKDKLLQHNKNTLSLLKRLSESINLYYTELSPIQIQSLLYNSLIYSQGLYPNTLQREFHQDLYFKLGYPHLSVEYIPAMEKFIMSFLSHSI